MNNELCVMCDNHATMNGFCSPCSKELNESCVSYDTIDEALATYMIEDAQLASQPSLSCELINEINAFIETMNDKHQCETCGCEIDDCKEIICADCEVFYKEEYNKFASCPF